VKEREEKNGNSKKKKKAWKEGRKAGSANG